MANSKRLFGENILHNCYYCMHCVVESGTNFCKVKKKINAKGKCSKFTYNPTLRKVSLQVLGDYNKDDFTL